MSEQPYPISCQSCGKQLYGPVSYCPYCAKVCATASTIEAAEESTTLEQVAEETIVAPISEIVTVQQSLPPQNTPPPESQPDQTQKVALEIKPKEQKIEPVSESKTEKPKVEHPAQPVIPTHKSSGNLKWVAIAVVLVVGIAGYLISHKKGGASSEPPGIQQSSNPATPGQGNKDSARIVAQDALRQGTGLSLTISKLPKLEQVLKAAKQLGDISPRYQEQITSAESSVSSARTDRDKSLMVYIGKVVELARYTPDQVSYALGVIQNGDISPREKIVAELLANHINSSRNNSKVDAKKLLADFNQRFSEFVD